MNGNEGLSNAKKLLTDKHVDAVCYNLLKDATSFGGTENEITFISRDKEVELGRHEKLSLAIKILEESQKLSSGI